jgi:hypothetical protein
VNIFGIQKFDHWTYLTTGRIFDFHTHFKTKWRTYKQRMRTDNVSSRLLRHHRVGAPRSRHLRGRCARSELTFWTCLVYYSFSPCLSVLFYRFRLRCRPVTFY